MAKSQLNVITKSIKRFLVCSDLHVPFLDEDAFEWLLEQIKDFKPHLLVLNGDLFEAKAASRWPSEYTHHLLDEYEKAGTVLHKLRKIAPKGCRLKFVLGNHDDNIQAPNRLPIDIRSAVAFHKHVDELKHWGQVPYENNPNKCMVSLGQVKFMHGFTTGKWSDRNEAVTHGAEWGLVIRGHTHRPVPVTQAEFGSVKVNFWYANTGCLTKFDPPMDYMKRKSTQSWGHAIVVGEASELKSPRVGRYWDAELRMRKMAWDSDVRSWKSAL